MWHADTGATEPVSFKVAEGRTSVSLKLEPWGTVFVVFRTPTKETSVTLPVKTKTKVATLRGPWKVSFQPIRGAPPSITLDKLASWSESSNPGVKYFPGSGTYTQKIDAPPDWFKKRAHLWIDLGDVRNLAEVTVNGRSLGIIWHAPFCVDATAALKPGANDVTIRVTNAWVNRLIGDQQPDSTTKYTFTTVAQYKANSRLQPSGPLRPVELYSIMDM